MNLHNTEGPIERTASRFARWPEQKEWRRAADILAIAGAIVLPWSTSALGIVMALWIVAVLPTMRINEFLGELRRPASGLPVAFVVLGIIGTFWADVAWSARLGGLDPLGKLLAIPLLIYHFRRSEKAAMVFRAFLASCAVLMAWSWITWLDPRFNLFVPEAPGVPVNGYIGQSQEFALCAFALAGVTYRLWNTQSYAMTALQVALIAAFIANMMFVVVSRTALICLPVLTVLFIIRHFDRRGIAIAAVTVAAAVAMMYTASDYLRTRAASVATEFAERNDNPMTGGGMRIEYWRKSLKFISEAPVIGNGTGSIRSLFQRDAAGKTGVAAEVIGNPHNQILQTAIQFGAVGVIVLLAMWTAHLWLFRGSGIFAWIGLVVVVQNIAGSAFNSHLTDFLEGWMYVLGVGVAAGFVQKDSALLSK